MRILLISPPCSMPDKPYISIPVLASYLKSKGLDVVALDANIEFYHRLLSLENVRIGLSQASALLDGTVTEETLNQLSTPERESLKHILRDCEGVLPQIETLFDNESLSNTERLIVFGKALRVACVPYYPELIDFTPTTNYVRMLSPFRKFSSQDILKSLQHPSLYSRFLEDVFADRLANETANVIGISVAFPDQILPAFQCARIIKRLFPGIHLTMGGTFVSCHMRTITEPGFFDFVDSFILDDGEIPLESLCAELSNPAPDLTQVPGLIYRDDAAIKVNEPTSDCNTEYLSAPDYSVFPLDRYLMPVDKMALLFRLSKGCYWGKCSFCKTKLSFIRDYRQPAAEQLYDQLKKLVSCTGVHVIHFTDDSADPEILELIALRMVRDKLNIRWAANVRIDRRLTMERLLLFKQAGCHGLYVGLESCNDRILKLMRKGTKVALIREILSRMSWSGINIYSYMIVGFPSETEEEARDSFALVKEFIERGDVRSAIYNVFEISPYSDVWQNSQKYGISEVSIDEKLDLTPPTSQFTSSGMSRQRAQELCIEFIGKLQQMKKGLLFPADLLNVVLTK